MLKLKFVKQKKGDIAPFKHQKPKQNKLVYSFEILTSPQRMSL